MRARGVLVAVGTADFETALLDAVAASDLHVVRRCVDIADLLATAASRQATIAFVSAQLRGLDRDVVARLRVEDVAVVGVTPESSSADEAALLRLGVEDFVAADALDTIDEAVAELGDGRSVAASLAAGSTDADNGQSSRSRGCVIAVWGPTGAPGRSTVALGIAAELAELGASTTLVDCDVYGGTIAQQLGLLDESSGLLAAARSANVGQLTPEVLARQARSVTPALRVLTGLPRADRWTEVRPSGLRDVIESARQLSAFTVLDCGFSIEMDEEVSYDTAAPRRNGATLAALDAADTVLVVGAADPIGLGRLVRALAELATVVPGCDRVVIVNRMRSSLGWSRDDVVAMLLRAVGPTPVVLLPDDRAAVDVAIVNGRTLTESAPMSQLRHQLRELAHRTAGTELPTGRRRRRVRA